MIAQQSFDLNDYFPGYMPSQYGCPGACSFVKVVLEITEINHQYVYLTKTKRDTMRECNFGYCYQ